VKYVVIVTKHVGSFDYCRDATRAANLQYVTCDSNLKANNDLQHSNEALELR
jgi:hypothetical protein